jgi:signal transduction histidine kinase
VITAALVFILQSGLVGALLIHRRRRRSAELQLKKSEERLLSTAASANVGLWQFAQETRRFWMTEHCHKLLRLPERAPLTLDSVLAIIHPEDREIASSLLQAMVDPGQQALADVRTVTADGKTHWIRIRTRVDPEEQPAPRQLRGTFVDITEQKVAETDSALRREEIAQLKRLREREGRVVTINAMSASIAHEISQPIGAMMASADAALSWLAKTPAELPNVRTSVERIATEGRRASDVIASVRSLFRRDGGGGELVDVNSLVREVLTIEQDELQRRGVVAKVELADVAQVSFDRIQLHQVVMNLVTNAMEAMSTVSERPRVLRVKTGRHATGEIVIAVEDSGVGIDRNRLDRIFEPFFTTKARGMGLGLWLCRRIVETHRGRLAASSEVGRGSRFEISLPCADAAAS